MAYIPNALSGWPTGPVTHVKEPYVDPPGPELDIADEQHRTRMIQNATWAASIGWIPIPIYGKIPTDLNWQKETNPSRALELTKARLKTGSANNVGLVCGAASNIMVVDIDQIAWTKNGLVHSGYLLWNQLIQQYGDISTFQVRTGKGGLHVYFKYQKLDRVNASSNRFVRGYGLDFRSDGGQVVMPGSIHPRSKHAYTILEGSLVGNQPILADMPYWLVQLIANGP